jgi:hypothetical protein
MRTWKCIGAVILMTLFFAPMAFADISIETAISQQSLNKADEKAQIEDIIKNSKLNPKEILVENKNDLNRSSLSEIESPAELEYGTPYKVVIPNEDVIPALLDGTSLDKSLKESPYYWEVPVLAKRGSDSEPVASFTIAHHENKWQIVEIGGYLSPEHSLFSSDPAELAAFLKNKSLINADSFVHFKLFFQHMDFLYLDTKDQEYFIPLIHGRDELYGLRSKTIYTRDEVVAAIGPVLKGGSGPNPLISGQPAIASVPTMNNESNQENIGRIALVLFLGALFSVGAVYGYRKLILR